MIGWAYKETPCNLARARRVGGRVPSLPGPLSLSGVGGHHHSCGGLGGGWRQAQTTFADQGLALKKWAGGWGRRCCGVRRLLAQGF